DVVPHVQVLLNDRAVDGGGDGVVLQALLGALQGELGGGHGVFGVLHRDAGVLTLGGHVGILNGADDLVLGDPVALLDGEADQLAAGLGGDLGTGGVGEASAGGAVRAPHRSGAGGGVGERAGVVHQKGDFPHQRAARPHAVGGGDG